MAGSRIASATRPRFLAPLAIASPQLKPGVYQKARGFGMTPFQNQFTSYP